jgi:hypothetical protein
MVSSIISLVTASTDLVSFALSITILQKRQMSKRNQKDTKQLVHA